MNVGSDLVYIDFDIVKVEKIVVFFNKFNICFVQFQLISYVVMIVLQDENIGLNIDLYNMQLFLIWELDGFIQVFLKYINCVFYLYINSELFYCQLVVIGVM